MLDIRNIPAQGKNGSWWHRPHAERSIGALYNASKPSQYCIAMTVPWSYDLLFFIEETTASIPLL